MVIWFEVRVEARERIDPGQQAGREAVGDAFHAQHQPSDGIIA